MRITIAFLGLLSAPRCRDDAGAGGKFECPAERRKIRSIAVPTPCSADPTANGSRSPVRRWGRRRSRSRGAGMQPRRRTGLNSAAVEEPGAAPRPHSLRPNSQPFLA